MYIGDFNARNSEWWNSDFTNLQQGTKLSELAAQYSLNQVIDGRYVKHGRSIANYQILRDITSRCKSAIKEAKSNYLSRLGKSLNDPAITPKTYWSILNSFVHKRKIPKIPPIRHNNTFLTDTLVKANTFTSFFAKQCSLIETGSELPPDYLLTHHSLELVNFDPAKILSIICAFEVSKAHGWDEYL